MRYYIRLKTKSNDFILGYKFSKTKRSCTEITRYSSTLSFSENYWTEEYQLRKEINLYVNEVYDWYKSNVKLKEYMVNILKPFAKKYKLKIHISKYK